MYKTRKGELLADKTRMNNSLTLHLAPMQFSNLPGFYPKIGFLRSHPLSSQQTMWLLLWVYDQSYTHKNGHLLSNMVIYHFLWSLKFFWFFCGHLPYLMVIDFLWQKFFSFSGQFLHFMVTKKNFVCKILYDHISS